MNSSDQQVKAFFESHGYSVDWDFKRASGEVWHEIYDGGHCICQIDMGIPLEAIVEDLSAIHTGTMGKNPYVYTINAPNDKRFDKLCETVYNSTL